MNAMSQAVLIWQTQAAVVVAVLLAVVLVHHARKVWRSPGGMSLTFLLGAGLALMLLLYALLRSSHISLFDRPQALLFLLLYVWCALGTLFLAARHTHAFKLMVALVLQGGIIYGLYRFV